MWADKYPDVRLIRIGHNVGEYIVPLNSNAFVCPGALQRIPDQMEGTRDVGMAGWRLICEDGNWQPSARQFRFVLNDFLSLSGLAHRFRTSPFRGRADRAWADPHAAGRGRPGTSNIPDAILLRRSRV
jgi:hypothetical protein